MLNEAISDLEHIREKEGSVFVNCIVLYWDRYIVGYINNTIAKGFNDTTPIPASSNQRRFVLSTSENT